MIIIGAKINLVIDEPWDSSKIIEGRIIQKYTGGDKTYYLIKDTHSEERFIVTNRYIEDNLNDVFIGFKLIVAIALPEKDVFSFDDSEFISHLSYFGIGSIMLSKTP